MLQHGSGFAIVLPRDDFPSLTTAGRPTLFFDDGLQLNFIGERDLPDCGSFHSAISPTIPAQIFEAGKWGCLVVRETGAFHQLHQLYAFVVGFDEDLAWFLS